MDKELREASLLGCWEDVEMDPNLELHAPLHCLCGGQELPQLSHILCLHPCQLWGASFNCITCADER